MPSKCKNYIEFFFTIIAKQAYLESIEYELNTKIYKSF